MVVRWHISLIVRLEVSQVTTVVMVCDEVFFNLLCVLVWLLATCLDHSLPVDVLLAFDRGAIFAELFQFLLVLTLQVIANRVDVFGRGSVL